MTSDAARVAKALGVAEGAVHERRAGELTFDASPAALPAVADAAMSALNGRLVSLFATDERATAGRFLLHHI